MGWPRLYHSLEEKALAVCTSKENSYLRNSDAICKGKRRSYKAMKALCTKIKAEMEFEAEKEARDTSMHSYAVILHAREAFKEITAGDLHAFKHDLAEKCANRDCNTMNLVSKVKEKWVSCLPAIHCAAEIILEEDGGGDLWHAADKVVCDYRISIYFLEEIEHRISLSLVAT